MATSKDDFSQHRSSTVHPSSRPHAHSLSLGAVNPAHRINRRKSSSSMAGVNMTAIAAAAAKEASGDASSHISKIKQEFGDSRNKSAMSEVPSATAGRPKSSSTKGTSAVVDGPPLSTMLGDKSKTRVRRASEGSRLTRGERRRSAAGELRCEKCGKGYKHGSCLTKHLWEHTPEWSLTSKLLISKHQQVQLLEAASVLVSMNNNGTSAANESGIQESESSGDSPAASGLSDQQDEESSRTSTPSQDGETPQSKPVPPRTRHPSRQDSYNSAFSRSFASTSGHSFAASSAPTELGGDLYWYRSSASRRRPSTSSQSHYSSDEQADVTAAAEGLVSCSLGTPKHMSTHLPDDIPPVPPLPAQFAGQASRPVSFNKGYQVDVEMSDVRGREDDDDGVFGHMER